MTDRQPTDRVAEVVAVLAALGVRRGDNVLLQMPEGRRCTQAVVGMLELGVIPLQVDPALSPSAVVTIATESGARLVLASPQGIRALAHLAAEPPVPVPVDGLDGFWAAVLRLG